MKDNAYNTSGSSPTDGEDHWERLLRDFANTHHLKIARDVDGTTIILGKFGHLFQYNESELGVIFIPSGQSRTRLWNRSRVQAQAVGMVDRQFGDAEGSFSFDPQNELQARIAIKIAGARTKRQYSPDQLIQMRIPLEAARQNRPSP